jgi:hypothetical protein
MAHPVANMDQRAREFKQTPDHDDVLTKELGDFSFATGNDVEEG